MAGGDSQISVSSHLTISRAVLVPIFPFSRVLRPITFLALDSFKIQGTQWAQISFWGTPQAQELDPRYDSDSFRKVKMLLFLVSFLKEIIVLMIVLLGVIITD